MAKLKPFELRDFRQGRFAQAAVSTALAPANSVSYVRNVDFDTIIGSCVVRDGTTIISGSAVASGKSPLGLSTFTGVGGSPNYIMAVFKGSSAATLYYWNGSSWQATGLTALSNTAKCRFATLGGSVFITNNVQGMQDSSDGHTFGTTNSIPTYYPNLVYRYQARLMASGDPTYPCRVFFSSVVSSGGSPFITWSVTPGTGDYIDVNPDDGGYVTGFAETSTFALIFKNNGMYRFTALSNSTDPDNLFNVGAVSQEAITACQGLVYFYSGDDVWQTDGGYPQRISLSGISDILDAVPQSSWASVAMGNDGINIYLSVGNVTINSGKANATTINNCVLMFSPDNQSWTIRSYYNNFEFFTLYTDSNGALMRAADTSGNVQTIGLGTTDAGQAIDYEVVTQDLDFGVKAHLKGISDQIVSYNQYGQDGAIDFQIDGNGMWKPIDITLNNRVNYGKNMDVQGHFFNFRWYGQSTGFAPVWEGIEIETINDLGLV